jgi:hypothetical protein
VHCLHHVDKKFTRALTKKSEVNEDERKPSITGVLAALGGTKPIVGKGDLDMHLWRHLRGVSSSSDTDDVSRRFTMCIDV